MPSTISIAESVTSDRNASAVKTLANRFPPYLTNVGVGSGKRAVRELRIARGVALEIRV
jgi:hypothetical protein